jgi:nitronate monooxygenase
MTLLEEIGVSLPIVQAPMAGVSTAELAAAVCNTGALGSLGVAATDAAGARAMIEQLRALSARPFNVNLFVHQPTPVDPVREAGWLGAMTPLFAQFGATPPTALRPIYKSFLEDDAMRVMLLDRPPAVVSFHFGVPGADQIAALKAASCVLLATATSLDEALAVKRAGIDAVVA